MYWSYFQWFSDVIEDMKEIRFSEYDPKWPLQFNEERKRLLDVLAENAFCIHHIGSTAVPGLAAKPKIDIIS